MISTYNSVQGAIDYINKHKKWWQKKVVIDDICRYIYQANLKKYRKMRLYK